MHSRRVYKPRQSAAMNHDEPLAIARDRVEVLVLEDNPGDARLLDAELSGEALIDVHLTVAPRLSGRLGPACHPPVRRRSARPQPPRQPGHGYLRTPPRRRARSAPHRAYGDPRRR